MEIVVLGVGVAIGRDEVSAVANTGLGGQGGGEEEGQEEEAGGRGIK